MLKYLYHYNYRMDQKELAHLEIASLFNESPNCHWFESSILIDLEQSVYVNSRLLILAKANNFDTLLKQVKSLNQSFDTFKLIYYKSNQEDLAYDMRLKAIRDIASCLDGVGSIKAFNELLGVTKIEGTYYFGRLERNQQYYKTRQNKPFSYSNALPVYLAKALITIATKGDRTLKLVDPCCGIGTIVIEGCAMNYDIEGYEISYKVAMNAKKNMRHYGFDEKRITRLDMLQLNQTYDIAFLDIPYNLFSPFTLSMQQQLVKKCSLIASQLVLVSQENMNDMLLEIGYHIEQQFEVHKGYFKRLITICRRD